MMKLVIGVVIGIITGFVLAIIWIARATQRQFKRMIQDVQVNLFNGLMEDIDTVDEFDNFIQSMQDATGEEGVA